MHSDMPGFETCKNCGRALQYKFCAACGQKNDPLDQSLKELVYEIGSEISNLDGRIVNSLRYLFSSPGFLSREYLEGRRVAWLSPIRLYLAISVLYFAVIALTGGIDSDVQLSINESTDEEALAEFQRMGFANTVEFLAAVDEAKATWMPRVMFILIPIFAGLVYAAQRKSNLRYPQHFIFSMHVQTAWFGAFIVSGLLEYWIENGTVEVLVVGLSYVYALVYLALALQRVYGEKPGRAVIQSLLIGGIYGTATILAVSLIIVPLVI